MPYCQECGHFEQDISTCSSCGNTLTGGEEINASLPTADPVTQVDPLEAEITTPTLNELRVGADESVATFPEDSLKEPEQLESIAKPNENSVFKEDPVEFVHQEGLRLGSHRKQIESHLGKGLIKPVEVENCMDGFHFKYDEPPRHITKSEPQNEKVVEFRVSGERDLNTEVKEEKEEKELKEEEKLLKDSPPEVGALSQEEEKPVESIETVEPELELQPEPESCLEEPISDESQIAEEVSLPETELFSEIDNIEPEIHSDIEPEVLWKGNRTWNGLALKEEYRITERSVIIINGDGSKIKEIDWRLVSGIILKQNWLTKLLNIGNLEITGLNSEPLLILEGIDHPEQLQKMLVEILESKVYN